MTVLKDMLAHSFTNYIHSSHDSPKIPILDSFHQSVLYSPNTFTNHLFSHQILYTHISSLVTIYSNLAMQYTQGIYFFHLSLLPSLNSTLLSAAKPPLTRYSAFLSCPLRYWFSTKQYWALWIDLSMSLTLDPSETPRACPLASESCTCVCRRCDHRLGFS